MKRIIIFLLLLAFTGGSGYAMEINNDKKETVQKKKHKHLKHRKKPHGHLKHPPLPPHPKKFKRPPHPPLPPRPPLPPKPKQ